MENENNFSVMPLLQGHKKSHPLGGFFLGYIKNISVGLMVSLQSDPARSSVARDVADVVLFKDRSFVFEGRFVVDFGDGLTSSTSIWITGEATESWSIFSKSLCERLDVIFVVPLRAPRREVDCAGD
jgi:hypothetical protein